MNLRDKPLNTECRPPDNEETQPWTTNSWFPNLLQEEYKQESLVAKSKALEQISGSMITNGWQKWESVNHGPLSRFLSTSTTCWISKSTQTNHQFSKRDPKLNVNLNQRTPLAPRKPLKRRKAPRKRKSWPKTQLTNPNPLKSLKRLTQPRRICRWSTFFKHLPKTLKTKSS